MQELTDKQRLATELLGTNVIDWIAERRARRESERPSWTFDSIAAELADATGGAVQVSREAIRQWLAEADEVQAS